MVEMGLHPTEPGSPLLCESCGCAILQRWYGRVQERDGGYSYHCTSCMNVLARMAEALDDLEGPHGRIRIVEEDE